jgi:hypothetical protein
MDIKIKWNKLLRDKIKKKINFKKHLKKTNNSQKNKDQNWYKYKVTKHIWFLKGLPWNPRLWEIQWEEKKKNLAESIVALSCTCTWSPWRGWCNTSNAFMDGKVW